MKGGTRGEIRTWAALFILTTTTACSLKKTAVNAVADVLGESEGVYLSDEDPELIEAALPFNIKTIETLLVTSPEHRGLLLSAATSIMLYAYGFVEVEAERIEDEDFDRAEAIRNRATRLYRRVSRRRRNFYGRIIPNLNR